MRVCSTMKRTTRACAVNETVLVKRMATHRRNDLLISATPLRESPCKAFSRVRGTAPAQRINGQRRKCWTLARASVGGWAGEKEGRWCDCVYWWRVLYVLID